MKQKHYTEVATHLAPHFAFHLERDRRTVQRKATATLNGLKAILQMIQPKPSVDPERPDTAFTPEEIQAIQDAIAVTYKYQKAVEVLKNRQKMHETLIKQRKQQMNEYVKRMWNNDWSITRKTIFVHFMDEYEWMHLERKIKIWRDPNDDEELKSAIGSHYRSAVREFCFKLESSLHTEGLWQEEYKTMMNDYEKAIPEMEKNELIVKIIGVIQ